MNVSLYYPFDMFVILTFLMLKDDRSHLDFLSKIVYRMYTSPPPALCWMNPNERMVLSYKVIKGEQNASLMHLENLVAYLDCFQNINPVR